VFLIINIENFFGRLIFFALFCKTITNIAFFSMILIADSGSTKTHWSVISGKKITKEVFTPGINPFYQDEKDISDLIEQQLLPAMSSKSVDAIFFYGAGCSFPEKKALVGKALGRHFPDAIIEVQSDLLGAARSLFGRESGIACIIGTGSNSCYYDGKEITHNVSPLGYILGDEGSGAVLGKMLVADVLKNQLPEELRQKFMEQYALTPAGILENVYKKPFPNRYLARFTPFLKENLGESSIKDIVFRGFRDFVRRNLKQYEQTDAEVRFIGSVAYHFSDVLNQVMLEEGFRQGGTAQNPMQGLIHYHSHETI
jgi:N-acetylglucosamine kinase-like BadF-type ATPase